ncbi:MAG: carbohydrate-binding protein, partial [Aquabacterium sp.]
MRRLATVVYLPLLLVLTVASVAWLLARQADLQLPGWMLAVTALLLLAPASETVVAVINRLMAESLRPLILPRLAMADGIEPAHRTLVVVPAMLTHLSSVDALVAQLEQHYLANAEPEAQFVLLSDWTDAVAESMPADEPLLLRARTGLEALNQRHPGTMQGLPRFLLLHRKRCWSDSEGHYIGWERKRGKLEQLIKWLSDGGPSPFIDLGPVSQPAPGMRHLLTLDSDTDLPPGRLRALVAMAAHPLNQPRLDATGRHVVGGYGILQPRVVTPLPLGETMTTFHALFAGQSGVDPYSAASSELYQDLFGEGTFCGKGLINIAAARAVLVDRLPQAQVLSHDLLEGNLARCAGVSDITVLEDAPLHADVAAARLHRWTRGDWQLLPVRRRAGRDGVPMITRWKMVVNLRRSLVAPLSVLLLLWVGVSGVIGAGWVLAVVVMAYGAGPLLGALAGLAPSRDDLALRPFYRAALSDLGRALATPLWHLAMLLDQALMYGDAIVRACYRQTASRRLLLQWAPSAVAQAAVRHDLRGVLRQHARVPCTAAGLAVASGLAGLLGANVQGPVLAGLLAVWAGSPLWVWLVSRPRPRPQRERLDADSQDYLRDLARDTWRFYERHVGPDDHHLPPDNVQMLPHLEVAHRTSPTNIGLYLLAVACARELGFIGRCEMADRLAATLDTVDRLQRHRGHLFNWYDTRSLAVLPPSYVSTVDSGNCSAHLLALARACELAADVAPVAGQTGLDAALMRAAWRLRPLQPVLAAAPSLQALSQLTARHWPAAAGTEPGGDTADLRRLLAAARIELDDLHLGQGDTDDGGPLWLLHDHLATLESALLDMQADPAALGSRLLGLAARARRLALEADFSCLYDPRRRMLHIGLRGDSGQLDANHY